MKFQPKIDLKRELRETIGAVLIKHQFIDKVSPQTAVFINEKSFKIGNKNFVAVFDSEKGLSIRSSSNKTTGSFFTVSQLRSLEEDLKETFDDVMNLYKNTDLY